MPSDSMTTDYLQNVEQFERALQLKKSYDLVGRPLEIAERQAKLYFVDGLLKDAALQKILAEFFLIDPAEWKKSVDAAAFIARRIPYGEVTTETTFSAMAAMVLSGTAVLLIEGFSTGIVLHLRGYPARSLQEPDSDRVLRGARDSFGETIVQNTALIRRHIRDARLRMEHHSVGSVSKTDVVLCYLHGRADPAAIDKLSKKLDALEVKSLSMAQESLCEALLPHQWYNPFPKYRFTERPDTAAATVCEGGILLLVDGSPACLLLPTGFFDFFQDTNDYYFTPLVGSYLRLTRYLIYFLTLMLIPTWFLLIKHPEYLPDWLLFIQVKEPNEVPIFFQLLLVELVVNVLIQASLNTPSSLGGSFSVVSAMILGDFAVSARWFVPEVLLYMAFVAVANFSLPSFELGYAFKLFRISLLILIELFGIWGYLGGIVGILILLVTTPTITGKSYLAPLYPFDGERMSRLLVRRRMDRDNT